MVRLIAIFACIFSMCVKPPAHVSISDKSIEDYAEGIIDDSLKILSIGGFYLQNKVENLYLDLEYKGKLTDKKAKRKLSNYILGMIDHINKDEDLAPYLIKKTFTKNDISLSLSYINLEGQSSQVHLYDGNIIFSIYNKENNTLEKIHTLPFTEE